MTLITLVIKKLLICLKMINTKFKQTEIGEIPENWSVSTMSNVCKVVTDYVANGSFASLKSHVRYNSTPDYAILIRLVDFNNNFKDNYVYVNKDGYEFLKKSKLIGGEIIISNVGAYSGTTFLAPVLKQPMTLGPNSIMIKTNYNDIFYYYWLKSCFGQSAINDVKSGSAVPKFNKTDFKTIKVPVPPIEEQNHIATILSLLDDRIEINKKTIKTSEEIGQALFKRWFVDFEFLNEKGESYKSSGGEMIDSELGEIPRWWSVEKIADNLNICGGSTPSTTKNEYWLKGDICWATPKDLSSLSNPILQNTEKKITQEGLKGISSGLLPIGSILLSSRAPIGYLAINTVPTAINQGFIGIKCDKDVSSYFCYFWLKNNLELIKGYANGSTFLEISKSNFRCISFVKPQQKILDEFQKTISPIFENIIVNQKEIRELTLLRDSLLPKLLSGKIRIN